MIMVMIMMMNFYKKCLVRMFPFKENRKKTKAAIKIQAFYRLRLVGSDFLFVFILLLLDTPNYLLNDLLFFKIYLKRL